MIAYLKGIITQKDLETAILDVNGVGYEVCVSSKTLESLNTGAPTELLIYTCMRADSLKLYGFSEPLEKKLFLALIGINGVGPKMALALLSKVPSFEALLEMIETEDIKNLSSLPRVGRKKAQQIILALKGKLKEEWQSIQSTGKIKLPSEETEQFLISALLNLGFRMNEIKSALNQLETGLSKEEGLKKALYCLQPGK